MHRFFEPRSVAVVGVSDSPHNLGRAIVWNLTEFAYNGVVYLVGPKGGAFLGHKIYPSVAELPEAVDLAVFLIPAAAVPDVLRQCGEKGIRRVIVESAGFRELGSHREGLEQAILATLRQFEMRMIGPNCLGVINRHNGLAVPFMPFKAESRPGKVAVIAQSGGIGAMMVNGLASANLGFSKFASIGNKLDVDENDLLEYLMEDAETEVIFCYLEGLADGRRLMDLVSRSDKPVIIHKSNKGNTGQIIARSHSASLSSDDRVVEAALRQCGAIRTQEQRESLEMIKAFCLPPLSGRRLAVISRSGGHAVLAADAADDFGFELPPYPEAVKETVRAHSRAKVINCHNPLDLGDLFDLNLYRSLAESTLIREDIDGLVFIHNYQGLMDVDESRRLVASMGEIMEKAGKPVGVCVFTTQDELLTNQRRVTFPLFDDPRAAIRSLARVRDRRRPAGGSFAAERPSGLQPDRVREALQEAPRGLLEPGRLARILLAYGIDLVPWETASRLKDALVSAERLGFPVVLKTAEPGIVHKSDAGGVILDVRDPAGVEEAYGHLKSLGPGVLVQKAAPAGLEWFVGGRQDEVFGPVVLMGAGGIYVEILQETALRVAPVSLEAGGGMLDECRASALLHGVRGGPRLDREALLQLLTRVSWLLADFPEIRELDLNPVRVYETGCQALDWRAVIG